MTSQPSTPVESEPKNGPMSFDQHSSQNEKPRPAAPSRPPSCDITFPRTRANSTSYEAAPDLENGTGTDSATNQPTPNATSKSKDRNSRCCSLQCIDVFKFLGIVLVVCLVIAAVCGFLFAASYVIGIIFKIKWYVVLGSFALMSAAIGVFRCCCCCCGGSSGRG